MAVDFLDGVEFLRVSISAAGVATRRLSGCDEGVQQAFDDPPRGGGPQRPIANGFFYHWLRDAAGSVVGVDAVIGEKDLRPEDLVVLRASDRVTVDDYLVIRFTKESQADSDPASECLSAILRDGDKIILLLGISAEPVAVADPGLKAGPGR